MTQFLDRPYSFLGLVALWMVLTGFSIGNLVLGAFIAWIALLATAPLELPRGRVRRWGPMFRLLGIVLADIVRSNIAVARIVLSGPAVAEKGSGFLDLEIDLDDENALAMLAIILTATPGTAWLDYHRESRRLLLHILDLGDPEEWRGIILDRYVRLLREAYE
ncbi:MAG: Na+/H+ antiporter subunit E [Paracoccus sp. (in: a-proteobacteria)]|nr:Na+/H+ antiporter subunit E [Paracoccus sp. (in: a-proteobacteria)]